LDYEEIEVASAYSEVLYASDHERPFQTAMNGSYDLWLSKVCESEATRRRYIEDIQRFEKYTESVHNLRVLDIPNRWREAKYTSEMSKEKLLDEFKDLVDGYFSFLKDGNHYTSMSINRSMTVVMSYLHYYDIPIKPVRIRHPYVIYHNRDITKEEIIKILDHSDVRNRAMFLLLFESGMRPSTLVNLKWRHIKEEFLARRVPMKIELTSDILKCRVTNRYVFIGDDGYQALTKYLSLRLPLRDDDFVFVTEKPAGARMRTSGVSQLFNSTITKLGLAEKRGTKPKALRLYCLRKAFRKFMATQVDSAYVEFWMGHTSTATHYLSEDVEHHRAIYAKGYKGLQLFEPRTAPTEIIESLQRKDEEIKKLKQDVEKLKPLIDFVNRLDEYGSLQTFLDLVKNSEVIEFPNKGSFVNLDLDEDEVAAINELAKKKGISRQEAMRLMIREATETNKETSDSETQTTNKGQK